MHNEPLISVIVFVKDSPEALKKCLDTLLLQIYNNIEIICVDKSCSSEIISLLYAYKPKFNRFEILHLFGSNAGQAWNEGLKIAQGKYIHFVNTDCWFMLDLYKIFAETSADKDADISIINAALHKGDIIDVPYYEFFDDEDLTKINDDMIYSYKDIHHIMTKNFRVLDKIYKKQFLADNNLSFWENNNYCEYLFNIQTLLKSSSVYINPEVYIRSTEQVITDGLYTEKVFDIFDVITRMQEYLISENLLRDHVFDFFNFICNSLDDYYKYCPNYLKKEYFDKLKMFILSRFNTMPQDIQNYFLQFDNLKFLVTSTFEEYDDKKQL